jgi:hypothetical protein
MIEEIKLAQGCVPQPWDDVNPNKESEGEIPQIASQFVPQDVKWKTIPVESCIYKQNNISKSSMAYWLNNYQIETIITCK